MLLYCFIPLSGPLSKPGPQVGNDRLGINGGVVKLVSHRQTSTGRATVRSYVDQAAPQKSPWRPLFRGAEGRCRRVSPIAPNPGEGLLTEPTPAVRPWSREQVFMPYTCRRDTHRDRTNWVESGLPAVRKPRNLHKGRLSALCFARIRVIRRQRTSFIGRSARPATGT